MDDEEKTQGGRKPAARQEGETVAGGQSGETPQFTAGEQPVAAPPAGPPPCLPAGPAPILRTILQTTPQPTPPPLTGAAVQAAAEYGQIAGELGVASTSVGTPARLQATCGEGFWCLPDVNCSARDFTSEAVREAFFDNRQICVSGVGVGLFLVD